MNNGQINHESDVTFHLYAADMARKLKQAPQPERENIFQNESRNSIYDKKELRAKVRYYMEIKV